MDKELALALDFKKAPVSLQEAATKHYANLKALTKAKVKAVESQAAVDLAQKAYDESAKQVRIELKNWTPEA